MYYNSFDTQIVIRLLSFMLIVILLYYIYYCHKHKWTLYDNIIKYSHIDGLKPLDKDACFDNLITFQKICQELDIPFWLSEGTALGMRRDNDFIEWDNDIDIGIFIEYLPRFQQKGKELLEQNGFLIGDEMQNGTFWHLYRNNEKIDIDFTGYGIKCVSTAILNGKHQEATKCDIVIDTLEPFQLISYKGYEFYVPSDRYLKTLYGNDWMIPQKI